MNERIKELRIALGLTQQQFAERIRMKRNSVALIENGRNTSDQTINAICREFNVNEEWLRTGNGEMFLPDVTDELDALAKKYNLTDEMKIFIERFMHQSAEVQEALIQFIDETATKLWELKRHNNLSDASTFNTSQHETIDQKVADYRRQLEEEENSGGEKSEVSRKEA